MIDPNLQQLLSRGYAKIGDISYQIAINLRKGKDHIPSQRKLYETGIKMSMLLKVLFRHVDFTDTGVPILYRITEIQVNKFLRSLIQLGDLENYPIVPTLIPNVKPIIITTGAQGATGLPGANGIDANIIVESAAGEVQIIVNSTVVSGVKHYQLSLFLYTLPLLSAFISGTKLFENGTSNTISLTLTITKTKNNIVTLVCNISGVNTILQPLINLGVLNGITQPNNIILSIPTQTAPVTYNFTLNDGTNNVLASDAISFVYPYFYGGSDASALNPYTNLTKLIVGKANRGFLLNGSNTKFSIGYPQSYGSLTRIRDGNGFDVTSDWTRVSVNVSSSGLSSDYVNIPYYFYITNVKTSISNMNYSIEY